MADRSIMIRFASEGGREVENQIRRIGDVAASSFGRATEAASRFQMGGEMGIGGLARGVFNAGGIRNFAAMAGGPLGVAAVGAGAIYQETSRLAELQKLGEKANMTASEVEGLQKVFGKLGVETQQSGAMLGAFSEKLLDSKGRGADLARVLAEANIATTNLDGSSRSASSVMAELGNRIKQTTDEDEKLRLATAAVGSELAGAFIQAVERSNTGLADLASASREAGGSFTNDLARGAKAAEGAIDSLRTSASLAYSQLKQLVGIANGLDKIKIAEYNLDSAKAGNPQPTYDAMGNVTGYTTGEADPQKIAAAQIELANARLRATVSGELPRMTPLNAAANRLGQPVPPEDAEGGGGRGASGLASNYDALAASLARLTTAQQLAGKELFVFNEVAKLNAAATEEERNAIAQQASALYDLRAASEAAAAGQRQLGQDLGSAAQQFLQAGIQGRNFGEVLRNILGQIASRGLSSGIMSAFTGSGGGSLLGLLGLGGGSKGAITAGGEMYGPMLPGASTGGGGLFSAIGSLFSGLFAEGGSIPAGHWGIAGERGPEPVFGPATVMPNRALRSMSQPQSLVINQTFQGVMTREDVAALARREAAGQARNAQTQAAQEFSMRQYRTT